MSIADLATNMIASVRDNGQNPALVAVSPDLYTLWQEQNAGIEPCVVSGIPIRIRDYKPKTMLILGHGDATEGDLCENVFAAL